MCSYDPTPVTFDTFASTFTSMAKLKGSKPPDSKFFGTNERFNYLRKSKSTKLIVPGPGNYDLTSNWPSKHKKDAGKTDWMKKISKGPSINIYYS